MYTFYCALVLLFRWEALFRPTWSSRDPALFSSQQRSVRRLLSRRPFDHGLDVRVVVKCDQPWSSHLDSSERAIVEYLDRMTFSTNAAPFQENVDTSDGRPSSPS